MIVRPLLVLSITIVNGTPQFGASICGLYCKSFMIIIYNRNDSSQYYNTMITIISYAPNLTLALASVINYDRK